MKSKQICFLSKFCSRVWPARQRAHGYDLSKDVDIYRPEVQK